MALGAVAATGMGLGLSPIAPGTVGTLWGVLLVFLFWPILPHPGLQAAFAALLSVLAIPICNAGDRWFRTKDDRRIVADEYLTFPLCMIGLPATLETGWVMVLAFVTCRAFDILKPPPAYGLQRLRGGLGIVMDDVIASLYSLALNHILYRLILRWIAV
jgi:phosphatidylglycerophosphatase A